MKLAALFRHLARESKAVAVVEFGLALPLMTAIAFTGAELTNFVTTKMRISQLALHIADNAARIGTGTVLANKQITEAQLNDLLTGANFQGGRLDLYGKGRVILSSIEPVANPNPTNRYRIRWQRCRGAKNWPSSYGRSGDSNLTGITVGGQTATAPDDGALMFVEIAYDYQPLIARLFIPQNQITAVAAMTVRDQRDYGGGSNGIYNNENVVPATC
ncbi:pilus assembly protein [Sphingobium sp. AR-3-1]|uniref:Pilus assembly protein n=1 Tax=Sphingobium psychrophilum TaxID=2728834 RepID=A0A7X9WZQ9_9SPHN|nr:pilus assembly protein [Sphingobium psychrophilum]MBJ7441747.1 pilus assembly protein [Sphingopyxis sp.]NML12912.1 pilus assembly protein [Sphingobium psychrophilum]